MKEDRIRLCKDCKHFREPLDARVIRWMMGESLARCAALTRVMDGPRHGDLVRGRSEKPRMAYCDVERTFDIPGRCGAPGRLWEPRP